MRKTISINRQGYEPIEPQGWEDEHLKMIAEARNLEYSDVVLLLNYTVISYSQLSLITGVSESNLRNLTVKRQSSNGMNSTLNECNPFPDAGKGKKFVSVDEKCKEYILKSLKLGRTVTVGEMVEDQ